MNSISICSDHSGFELKVALCNYLKAAGIPFMDWGCWSAVPCDYYESLKPCIEHMRRTSGCVGVAICMTGQGFNIAANKADGIRSALCRDAESAEDGKHVNANFYCLAARYVGPEDLPTIVAAITQPEAPPLFSPPPLPPPLPVGGGGGAVVG